MRVSGTLGRTQQAYQPKVITYLCSKCAVPYPNLISKLATASLFHVESAPKWSLFWSPNVLFSKSLCPLKSLFFLFEAVVGDKISILWFVQFCQIPSNKLPISFAFTECYKNVFLLSFLFKKHLECFVYNIVILVIFVEQIFKLKCRFSCPNPVVLFRAIYFKVVFVK